MKKSDIRRALKEYDEKKGYKRQLLGDSKAIDDLRELYKKMKPSKQVLEAIEFFKAMNYDVSSDPDDYVIPDDEVDQIKQLLYQYVNERGLTGKVLKTISYQISKEERMLLDHLNAAYKASGINLREGDLIYGLHKERGRLYGELKLNLQDPITIQIDSFNDKGISIGPEITPDIQFEYKLFADRQKMLSVNAINFHQFALRFDHERYKDQRYTYSPDSNMYGGGGDSYLVPFIKKRCKLGILWVLHNHRKIHFILDDIDLKKVFSKTRKGYTGSELRFIYRNWEQLKYFYENGQINFYRRNAKGILTLVKAPWVENPEIVGVYKPKSKNKYLDFFKRKELKEQAQDISISKAKPKS